MFQNNTLKTIQELVLQTLVILVSRWIPPLGLCHSATAYGAAGHSATAYEGVTVSIHIRIFSYLWAFCFEFLKSLFKLPSLFAQYRNPIPGGWMMAPLTSPPFCLHRTNCIAVRITLLHFFRFCFVLKRNLAGLTDMLLACRSTCRLYGSWFSSGFAIS